MAAEKILQFVLKSFFWSMRSHMSRMLFSKLNTYRYMRNGSMAL